jgi:hypothetical protein
LEDALHVKAQILGETERIVFAVVFTWTLIPGSKSKDENFSLKVLIIGGILGLSKQALVQVGASSETRSEYASHPSVNERYVLHGMFPEKP